MNKQEKDITLSQNQLAWESFLYYVERFTTGSNGYIHVYTYEGEHIHIHKLHAVCIIEGFTITNFIIFTPITMYIDCARLMYTITSSSSLDTASLKSRRFLDYASRNQMYHDSDYTASFFFSVQSAGRMSRDLIYIDVDLYKDRHILFAPAYRKSHMKSLSR